MLGNGDFWLARLRRGFVVMFHCYGKPRTEGRGDLTNASCAFRAVILVGFSSAFVIVNAVMLKRPSRPASLGGDWAGSSNAGQRVGLRFVLRRVRAGDSAFRKRSCR